MGQYENDGSVAVNVAKVLLLLVNMAFLVGGGLLIFFSQRVRRAGWLDAFADSDYAWVGDTTLLFILILGAVVIALAALGCFGAWLRSRVMLTIYTVVLIITAALFVVVAIGANSVKSKANGWAVATYPADNAEEVVGGNFNEIYCYAQVKYYCETASVTDLTSLFGLNVPAVASALVGNLKLSQLCGAPAQPEQFAALCEVCKLVNQYSNYLSVADWAAESCERSAQNQLWCGKFLMATQGGSGSAPEPFATGSPYNQCRGAFLELVAKWSNFLFASALIVTISTVAVFGFACLVRQGTNRPYLDDSFVVDSPDRD